MTLLIQIYDFCITDFARGDVRFYDCLIKLFLFFISRVVDSCSRSREATKHLCELGASYNLGVPPREPTILLLLANLIKHIENPDALLICNNQ